MNIAFVRGAHLNPWELQTYAPLARTHPIVAVGADWQFYKGGLDFTGVPVRRAGLWGAGLAAFSDRLPVLYNRALSWTLGSSFGLSHLEELTSDADILHSAELHFTMTHQCLQIKKKRGCRVVATIWENLPHAGERHPFRKIRKQQAIRECDGFLAVTETTRTMLLNEGVAPERIQVIPMGIDLSRFSPASDPSSKELVILFMGRLVEEKGVLDLLEAIPEVLKGSQGLPVRFCFVGAGPLLKHIRAFQNRYPEAIRYHPFASYDQVPSLHRSAAVLILPSRPSARWQEQFGYVLIESMACGKPVITTRTGSIPDVVGEAGIVVEPGQPAVLSAKILSLIHSPPERKTWGEKALARARSQFDAEACAARIEDFYERILQREAH